MPLLSWLSWFWRVPTNWASPADRVTEKIISCRHMISYLSFIYILQNQEPSQKPRHVRLYHERCAFQNQDSHPQNQDTKGESTWQKQDTQMDRWSTVHARPLMRQSYYSQIQDSSFTRTNLLSAAVSYCCAGLGCGLKFSRRNSSRKNVSASFAGTVKGT